MISVHAMTGLDETDASIIETMLNNAAKEMPGHSLFALATALKVEFDAEFRDLTTRAAHKPTWQFIETFDGARLDVNVYAIATLWNTLTDEHVHMMYI